MASPNVQHSKSILTAIHEKYDYDATSGKEEDHSDFCEIFVPAKGPGKTAGQVLQLPDSIGLESYNITCAGDTNALSTLCSAVKELNLTHNSISDWHQVFRILEALPSLELINVTRNPLLQLTTSLPGKIFPVLTKLVLNFTNMTWQTIGNILSAIPNLEELYLSGNSYEEVTLDIPAYDSLRLLQLTENNIRDWKDVQRLDKVFPKLRNLTLAHNNITSCGNGDENASMFAHLSVLNMNNTAISEWDELDKLSAIKSVSDIRLFSIPLTSGIADREKLMRLLSVHFSQLRLINGSPAVSGDTAERVYMRHFEECSDKPAKYHELVAKHGTLQQLAEVDMTPPFSFSTTIECDGRQEVWDIPAKQTIGQLKKCLSKFVGSSNFKLVLAGNAEHGPTEFLSTCSNRFVYSFLKSDGETLLCHKFDTVKRPIPLRRKH
ncbi:tubulin-specific chaperone cofactor E-like protein [Watersipora subatra]|uniref:tubulin-specific chaperone cofactor E-like protein n=1 Tax=Watersipora subatra TaxID=2589382 RepID=UPI00355ADFDC